MYVRDLFDEGLDRPLGHELGVRANRIAEHYSQGEWLEAAADVGRLEAWAFEQFKYQYVADTVMPWCAAVMELLGVQTSGDTGVVRDRDI
jgi:hypothetical protein